MATMDHSTDLGPGVLALTSGAEVDFLSPQPEWLSAHGLPQNVVFPKQVHGDVIWEAEAQDAVLTGEFEADAVVTREVGLPIAVRTADCVPILIHDPEKKLVAAVHAGWKGTVQKIAGKTIELLKASYSVDPKGLKVVIAPCMRKASYEVGEEFRDYFPQDVEEINGRLHVDVTAANVRQLVEAGVLPERIIDQGLDTYADPALHSFRHDGDKSGRMLSVIMMK